MSEEQNSPSQEENVQAVASSGSDSSNEDEFVPKNAYLDVTRDMHKYKSEKKELKAKLAEYEAKAKAEEEARMKEQENWKALAEKLELERQQAIEASQTLKQQVIREKKLQALKSEIGNIKDDYLIFANLDAIEVDENGSLSSESVREVANAFRESHGELIPQSNSANITSRSASSTGPVAPNSDRRLSEMTFEERARLLSEKKSAR